MCPVTISLILVLLGLLVYRYLWKDNIFKARGIEYPPTLPICGNMLPVLLRRIYMGDYLRQLYNHYKDLKYFGFYNFTSPVTVIRDQELIGSIAMKNFDHFTDHVGFVDADLDPLFGKNLFALRGDEWREVRKLLSPSFTSAKMKSMFKLIVDCADKFTEFVAEEAKNGKDYDLKDVFRRYTNDVVATTNFGISVDSMKDPNNEFFTLATETINFTSTITNLKFLVGRNFPMLSRLLRIRIFGEKPRRFFHRLVSETVRMREEKGISRPDMIQLMMESKNSQGKRLTIDEMTNQAFVFFVAGFDSAATLMCIAAHEIAVNSEVREKLRAEIEEVSNKLGDGKPTYDAIRDMSYMDAVLDEAGRMYPVAQFLDRMCVKDFELPPAAPGAKPVLMKPGDQVWFLPCAYHHDPQYFKDPDVFNPERFLTDSIPPNVYMPFGLGPRVCIGNRFALMETKVMFYYLLKRCLIEPCAKTTIPLKFNKALISPIPVNGYWLKFKKRDDYSSTNGHVANGTA